MAISERRRELKRRRQQQEKRRRCRIKAGSAGRRSTDPQLQRQSAGKKGNEQGIPGLE